MTDLARREEQLGPFLPPIKIDSRPQHLEFHPLVDQHWAPVTTWTLYFAGSTRAEPTKLTTAIDSDVVPADLTIVTPRAASGVVAPVYRWSWFALLMLALAAGIAIGASLFAGVGLDLGSTVVIGGAIPVLGATLFAIGGSKHREQRQRANSGTRVVVRRMLRPVYAVGHHRSTR